MNALFDTWFSSNQITNENAVQSAKKAEKLFNPNYNCLMQLSEKNLTNLRNINERFKSYNNLNLGNVPTLSEEQLAQTEYLLAGDAGEQLVDQAVRMLANRNKIILRNVLLPYQYGQYGSNKDNQIDNLVISDSGVYCIEVKVRKILGNTFDFTQLEPDIYYQLSFHKEAVLQTIRANMPFDQDWIKAIVVIVNRKGVDNFRIINDQELERSGAKATPVKSLDLTLTNGLGKSVLTPDQISKINQIIWNSRIKDRRTYPHNVCINLNSYQIQQLYLALNYHLPIQQIISYHVKLNDYPLTGLSNTQQNFFWVIVNKLYQNNGQATRLTRKELQTEANYSCKDYSRLDQSLLKLTQFMESTGLFEQINYKSKIITITVKSKYRSLFNQSTNSLTFWNYQLLKKMPNSWTKNLFRKLVQYAEAGCYSSSFQNLRKILAIPDSYSNSDVLKLKIEPALTYLTSLFSNLQYEITKDRYSNKILDIKFTFNSLFPQELLSSSKLYLLK